MYINKREIYCYIKDVFGDGLNQINFDFVLMGDDFWLDYWLIESFDLNDFNCVWCDWVVENYFDVF